MTDEAPSKKSIECLIEIASNTRTAADRQNDQRRDFQAYIGEERETHRLLDTAMFAMKEAILKVSAAVEKTNLVVEKTSESLEKTNQTVTKMNGLINKALIGLVVVMTGSVVALIVYIYTVLPHPA